MSYEEINAIIDENHPERVRARELAVRLGSSYHANAYLDGLTECRLLMDLVRSAMTEGREGLAQEAYETAHDLVHNVLPKAVSAQDGRAEKKAIDGCHKAIERLEQGLDRIHSIFRLEGVAVA